MALEINDLMMLRGMDSKEGLSPYEQVKLDHMTAKSHTGGVAVAGLVTGVAGAHHLCLLALRQTLCQALARFAVSITKDYRSYYRRERRRVTGKKTVARCFIVLSFSPSA